MVLNYQAPQEGHRGLIAEMQSYVELLTTEPARWLPEVAEWEQFDQEVVDHPHTVGACVFLSSVEACVVGFGSYDPRRAPEFGPRGHSCIIPEYHGRGLGKLQIREILRRLSARGSHTALCPRSAALGTSPRNGWTWRAGSVKQGRDPRREP